MNHFLKLTYQIFAMKLREIFEYRFLFWMQFIGSTLGPLCIAYFLWMAIFETSQKAQIGGYTFNMMIFYYIMAPSIQKCVRGMNMRMISIDIYEGHLTKYLLYPTSIFHFKLTQQLAHYFVDLILLVITVLIYIYFFGGIEVSAIQILMGLILSLFSCVLYFLIEIRLELYAFWTDTTWSLSVLLRFLIGFLGGTIAPLSIYPEWAYNIIQYTPFPHLVYFPTRLMMGMADFRVFLFSLTSILLWSLIAFLSVKLTWKKGLYEYTGVGI